MRKNKITIEDIQTTIAVVVSDTLQSAVSHYDIGTRQSAGEAANKVLKELHTRKLIPEPVSIIGTRSVRANTLSALDKLLDVLKSNEPKKKS